MCDYSCMCMCAKDLGVLHYKMKCSSVVVVVVVVVVVIGVCIQYNNTR